MQPTPSPYSIRGIAASVGNAYSATRGAAADAMERVHNTFGTPAGYSAGPVSSMAAPAPAPVPAPAPAPQLGGVNLNVMQQREQAAGLKNGGPVLSYTASPVTPSAVPVAPPRGTRFANGGVINGPGTGTSDSIPTAMPTGSYVMPADSTQQVQQPVDVSNGETALSPDQVHAVGQAALEAMRGVTHKTVKMPRRRGKANGGPISALTSIGAPFSKPFERTALPQIHPHPVLSRADGGPVDQTDPNSVRAVLPPAGSQQASQIPTGGYGAVPAADGSHDAALGGTAGRVLDTVNAVAPALGPQGAAVARLATGAVNAGRVISGIAGVSKLAPLIPPAAGYGALVSASSPAAPAAAPAQPAAATPAATNPTDQRLAQGTQGADASSATGGAPAGDDTGIPGVRRLVDANGRPLFTNVADPSMGGGGDITPQNSQAADALSDRYGAQAMATGPSAAAANLPAGVGANIPADTGGYGILDRGYQAARTASIDNADAAQLASRLGRSGAQVLGQGMGNQAAITETGMREGAATGRTELAETGQTQRERENNAAMLQREGPTRFLTNMEQATKLRGAIGVMSAQDGYRQALAGGDPKAIAAAEDQLRAAQGHWMRNFPELFSTTALPAQINADGSRTSPGAIVTDRRTGNVKIITADQLGTGKQPNPMPASKEQLVPGQTYQTARGPARWDGNQFVQ